MTRGETIGDIRRLLDIPQVEWAHTGLSLYTRHRIVRTLSDHEGWNEVAPLTNKKIRELIDTPEEPGHPDARRTAVSDRTDLRSDELEKVRDALEEAVCSQPNRFLQATEERQKAYWDGIDAQDRQDFFFNRLSLTELRKKYPDRDIPETATRVRVDNLPP